MVKVVTFNIAQLTHPNDATYNADVIISAGADVALLQEVSSYRMDTIKGLLADKGWASLGSIEWYQQYHPDSVRPGEDPRTFTGVGILARRSLSNPVVDSWFGYRVTLRATVSADSSTYWVYCVHVKPGFPEQAAYAYMFATAPPLGQGSKRIVGGDFNSSRYSPAMLGTLLSGSGTIDGFYESGSGFAEVDQGSDQYTFQYPGNPYAKIDYLFLTSATLSRSAVGLFESKSSDHRALAANIS